MRGSDWSAAIAIRDYWLQKGSPIKGLCPIFSSPEKLVRYLDGIELRPGHALDPCEVCGGEHRWAFLRMLVEAVLRYFPDLGGSQVVQDVDDLLAPMYEKDGGRDAYWKIEDAGETYFKGIKARTDLQ
jgi:hypothetical protein